MANIVVLGNTRDIHTVYILRMHVPANTRLSHDPSFGAAFLIQNFQM